MTNELELLRASLKAIRTTEWEQLARDAGCSASLPRKIVYETDRNFGVNTIAPLISHLRLIGAKPGNKKRSKAPA